MKPTIIDFLNESVEKYANNPFLWEKNSTEYVATTYRETKEQAHILAAGLLYLGVLAGDKIALLSEGRNAWIIGELGILHTGAVNVPLSIKLEESNDLIFRLKHSEAQYVLVSGGQLKKIRAIAAELPLLKKIIIFDEQVDYNGNEMSLSQLIQTGKEYLKKKPDCVVERAKTIQPNDLANISLFFGHHSRSQRIMLTHRNYTANVARTSAYSDDYSANVSYPQLFYRWIIALLM
jgi:long-chain acyl-CoA synthetase